VVGLTSSDGATPEIPYAFHPALPDPSVFGPDVPPLLDLTSAPESLLEAVTDDVDYAAADAAAAAPDAIALWRVWRLTTDDAAAGEMTRVYLLETDQEAAQLPATTATLMRALEATGHSNPLVEVYAPDTDLPAYQQMARGAAALLWTAESAPEVEIARVFDSVDPVSGPAFDADHPRLDEEERERVARYLDAGTPLLVTTQTMVDVVEPAHGDVVPMSYRTDGRWIWTDSVMYYLRAHGLAPDPELLDHMRDNNFVLPVLDSVADHRALAALFAPADIEAVWTA
jgi:hypothetical protein